MIVLAQHCYLKIKNNKPENSISNFFEKFADRFIMTGWKRADALGQLLATVFNVISDRTDKHGNDPVKKAIQEGSFYGLADRTFLIAKEGSKMPFDIIGSVIKDDRDNIIGVALIFYDIIERNRIYEMRKSY